MNHLVIVFLFINSFSCLAQDTLSTAPNEKNHPPSQDESQVIKQIEVRKMYAEIQKLEEEIENLKINNNALGPSVRRFTNITSAISGLIGALIGLLIWMLGRSVTKKFNATQAAKLQQDKELSREAHNLELFKSLSSNNVKIRLAAASVLLQRLSYLKNKKEDFVDISEDLEKHTIINVLVSVTKEEIDEKITTQALIKFIADTLVQVLDARVPSEIDQQDLFLFEETSPLLAFDFQKANLQNVWWKRVNARFVDFFDANLSKSSLTEAVLSNAVFYNATLKGTVFRNAVLIEANFEGAHLEGADFTGSNLDSIKLDGAIYDSKTKWPEGFNADSLGAIMKK